MPVYKTFSAIVAAVVLVAACDPAQAQAPTNAPIAPDADKLACTTEFLKRWQVFAKQVEELTRLVEKAAMARDTEQHWPEKWLREWICPRVRAVVELEDELIDFAQSDAASCGLGMWAAKEMKLHHKQMLVCLDPPRPNPCPWWPVQRPGTECKFLRP
jgi:hypothetical protein